MMLERREHSNEKQGPGMQIEVVECAPESSLTIDAVEAIEDE